jgi:hypothetical protein
MVFVMDMWNWLLRCYRENSIDIEELQAVMDDEECAENLWKDFDLYSFDAIDHVRSEVKLFLEYLKKNNVKQNHE